MQIVSKVLFLLFIIVATFQLAAAGQCPDGETNSTAAPACTKTKLTISNSVIDMDSGALFAPTAPPPTPSPTLQPTSPPPTPSPTPPPPPPTYVAGCQPWPDQANNISLSHAGWSWDANSIYDGVNNPQNKSSCLEECNHHGVRGCVFHASSELLHCNMWESNTSSLDFSLDSSPGVDCSNPHHHGPGNGEQSNVFTVLCITQAEADALNGFPSAATAPALDCP